MLGKRKIPPDHPAFVGLPVDHITVGDGATRMAVHRAGTFRPDRVPLICVPGYQRNMSDFTEFLALLGDWPVVLVDLLGRGRSDDRGDKHRYGSPRDAHDLSQIANALAIESAVFLGQGFGGQVVMALAAQRPTLIAGTILIDAGPVADPQGIVRMHHSLTYLENLRGQKPVWSAFQRMLQSDHPGAGEKLMQKLAQRCHYRTRSGRARPLYDPYLLKAVAHIALDDVLAAQWPLYDALAAAPLLLLRTQLTNQLRRETLDEMSRRRPDARALIIAGQGSPALLDHTEEVTAIAKFIEACSRIRLTQ